MVICYFVYLDTCPGEIVFPWSTVNIFLDYCSYSQRDCPTPDCNTDIAADAYKLNEEICREHSHTQG